MPFDGTVYQNDATFRLLREAQKLIRNPDNWCQFATHQTVNGVDQWCAWGAIFHVRGAGTGATGLMNEASRQLGSYGVVDLNNSTDHSTVMAMLDRACELRIGALCAE